MELMKLFGTEKIGKILLRLAAEAQLAKFRRKRGANGKYIKDE